MELVYLSNGSRIGDAAARITKVWTDDQGVQHFAIMTDTITGKFSEVVVKQTTQPANNPPTLATGNMTATVEAKK